jgi:chemotaxis signal transduction protein
MEATNRATRRKRKRAIDTVEAKVENIDFKMVTFTLAGKDYGIDIMKVKEIAKFVNFTYVPNTRRLSGGLQSAGRDHLDHRSEGNVQSPV